MMHLAQRRPGREPRRHADADGADGSAAARSTKAGARTPATRGVPRRPPPRAARSTKAGARTPATQRRAVASCAVMATAQRRPGREPRRHAPGASLTRSTPDFAQRRPGREPRRHPVQHHPHLARPHRSTKAGARTPATLAHVPVRAARHSRSTKAGARTPATPAAAARGEVDSRTAQRRPGREPRRHLRPSSLRLLTRLIAQRRPGREPRRHG